MDKENNGLSRQSFLASMQQDNVNREKGTDRFSLSRTHHSMEEIYFNLTNHPDDFLQSVPLSPASRNGKSSYEEILRDVLISTNNGERSRETSIKKPINRFRVLPIPEQRNKENSSFLPFNERLVSPFNAQLQSNFAHSKRKDRDTGSDKATKKARILPSYAQRILDAPEIVDDFYLNVIDYSVDDIMAVGLDKNVYLWNKRTGEINELLCARGMDDNYVTSVSWTANGKYLAVGTFESHVQIWDVESTRQIRNMDGHLSRVPSLSWNSYILTSGGRDSNIIDHDVRIKDHLIWERGGHTSEICGLKWNPNGSLLASGENNNKFNIWDNRKLSPLYTMTEHSSAVKALCWNPLNNNILCSSGGMMDKSIRMWNAQTGSCINKADVSGPTTAIVWSKSGEELATSHGYPNNQISVWSYPKLTKLGDIMGHTKRILSMALSSNGSTLISASSDETIRFWEIWDCYAQSLTKNKNKANLISSPYHTTISTVR